MMLFNLKTCGRCHGGNSNLKLSLWNILPKEICDKIDECNALCDKCHHMRIKQTKFIRKWTTHLYYRCESKAELIIKWFELNNGRPFTINKPQHEMDTLIKIIDNSDKTLINVLKSFARNKNGVLDYDIIWSLHYKISYKNSLIEKYQNLKTQTYFYRKKPYPENILMKMIFYEFILVMIGDDIHYIELEDIHQYLDDIFD